MRGVVRAVHRNPAALAADASEYHKSKSDYLTPLQFLPCPLPRPALKAVRNPVTSPVIQPARHSVRNTVRHPVIQPARHSVRNTVKKAKTGTGHRCTIALIQFFPTPIACVSQSLYYPRAQIHRSDHTIVPLTPYQALASDAQRSRPVQ